MAGKETKNEEIDLSNTQEVYIVDKDEASLRLVSLYGSIEEETIGDLCIDLLTLKEIIKYLETVVYQDLKLILGFVKGKDFKNILDLLPRNATYYFCKPNTTRGLPTDEIFEYSKKIGLIAKKFPSVKSAYTSCLNESSKDDLIFIGGSNFVVAEII